jgi:outer membrane lipoprotein SlyB
MKQQLQKLAFGLLCAICFLLSTNTVHSQEIRLLGGVQVYGGLTGAFVGPGIGIEGNLGKHFTINSDINFGFQEKASSIEFKPAVHFYFSKENKGFFIGPSFKYVAINEKNDLDVYSDEVYTAGFTLGLKSVFKGNIYYFIQANPHYAVGSSNGPGALGGVAGISVNFGLSYKL